MIKKFADYFDIILGTTLFAFSITWFAEPIGLVTGGVSGIAIIIKWLSGNKIPIFLTNLILNIPLFLICIKQRGVKFIVKSLVSVLWMTFALEAVKFIPNPLNVSDDILLSALLAGISAGGGLGFILRASATSGGSDMLAAIIKFKKPHFPISTLILIIDCLIILCGIVVFGAKTGIYAIISVYLSTKIINRMLDGIHFARGAFILSDKYREISKEIFNKLERGNTGIEVEGMYSKEKRKMLYVVVEPKEIIVLQNIVKEIDPEAFMTIHDVRRTLGEGFFEFEKLESIL